MQILKRALTILVVCAGLPLAAQADAYLQYRNDTPLDAGPATPGPTDPNGPPSLSAATR
jgi:hypothetical protein